MNNGKAYMSVLNNVFKRKDICYLNNHLRINSMGWMMFIGQNEGILLGQRQTYVQPMLKSCLKDQFSKV